ncbi:hypothetical protein [Pseudomonas sp. SID14000]|uniref:hypothetical protein n=1 Tax=Pseudomonas sp. SID14000 TaxID=1986221 RepID=UPI0011213829|nr:hypothetical protein [Pseudomonas sp. SID14000]
MALQVGRLAAERNFGGTARLNRAQAERKAMNKNPALQTSFAQSATPFQTVGLLARPVSTSLRPSKIPEVSLKKQWLGEFFQVVSFVGFPL